MASLRYWISFSTRKPDDLRLRAHRLGHGDHRRVGAVAGAEGVVAVDVGHVGQRLGELRVALLLAEVEPQVLQHQHLARRQSASALAWASAPTVSVAKTRPAGRAARPACRRPASCCTSLRSVSFGPPQMAHQDQSSAAVEHRAGSTAGPCGSAGRRSRAAGRRAAR